MRTGELTSNYRVAGEVFQIRVGNNSQSIGGWHFLIKQMFSSQKWQTPNFIQNRDQQPLLIAARI